MLKQRRKTIALICMILIGILGSFVFANQSKVVYAKDYNVNPNTLSVKCQLSTNAKATDDTTKMRLVSTISEAEVEKLSYVGFEIEFLADGDATAVTMLDLNNTVYAGITIDSTDAQGVSYDFTPKVFDMESKYFSTCTVSGIPQAYFDNGVLIKPFVVERGLNPNVAQNRSYGEHRYVKIMDVLSTEDKIMSVPVLGNYSDESNVQLAGNSCTVREKYFDGTYTHVRIAQDSTQLASVTTITVGDKTATYRNLYSETAVDTSWHTDGTGGVIVTEGDLYGFQRLSAQGERFADETVYLATDIDLNPSWTASAIAPTNKWTPVLNFTGTFDGGGRTIKGIYVSGESQVGFFQAVLTGATVQNFELKNSYINATGTGHTYAGAIAGIGRGSFANIYSNATVYSAGYSVGGMVGICNDGTANVNFTNCWNAGTVRGTSLVGGLFGYADACKSISVSNCLNTGTICEADVGNQVGGLGGRINSVSTGTISNCLNVGTVYGNNGNQGAIVGNDTSNVENLFSNVSYLDGCCTHAGGGIISKSGVSVISASDLKSETGYASTNLPLEYWEFVEGGTPELRMFSEAASKLSWYLEGNGQTSFEYEIKDAAELKGFRYISKKDNFSGDTVRLVSNIELDEAENWTPIASNDVPFAGTFNGNGKTITGMTIQSASNFNGLFQKVDGATIRDLTLNGAYQAAGSYNGGLIGWSIGNTTISSVDVNVDVPSAGFDVGGLIGAHTTGTLTISDSTCGGTISNSYTSNAKVGGFIGEVGGTVNLNKCRFTGSVVDTSTGQAGGFIGYTAGAVTLEECVLDGTVTGKNFAGGFIGDVNAGTNKCTIKHCLFTENAQTNFSGNQVGGFVGRANAGIVTIDDCILVGTTNAGTAPGFNNLVVGRVAGGTVTITNTYSVGKAGMWNARQWDGGTLTDASVVFENANYLKGQNGYTKTNLDFTYWRAIDGGYPELVAFKGNSAMEVPSDVTRADYSWYVRTNYYQGETTNTYTVSDASDLMGFAVVSQTDNFANDTIQLGDEDIVLNEGWIAGPTAPSTIWMPIGTSAKQFAGKFDGNGKTISGLYLNVTTAIAGMFTWTANSSEICNFRLENSYFTSNQAYLGAIAGVGNGTYTKIYSNATVVGSGTDVGGISGGLVNGSANISECWLEGKVVGNDIRGGFIGRIQGEASVSISNCLNKVNVLFTNENSNGGNLVGGYIGDVWNANLSITDSLSVGSVKSTSNAGSLCGRIGQTSGTTHSFTVNNVYALDTSHSNLVGSEQNIAEGMLDLQAVKYAANNMKGANAYGKVNLDYENRWRLVDNDYPELIVFKSNAPESVQADYSWFNNVAYTANGNKYILTDANDLMGFANVSQIYDFAGKTVSLGKRDITLNTSTEWVPIGNTTYPFAGTFDGNGKTVTGINKATASHWSGFFACVSNATIKDLAIEGTINAISYSGGLMGESRGTTSITDVYVNIDVNSSGEHVGGFVGWQSSGTLNISNCWNAGDIVSTYTTNNSYVGGFIGDSKDVASVSFTSCLNSGNVSGWKNFVGGFVGIGWGPMSYTDCLNTGTVTNLYQGTDVISYPATAFATVMKETPVINVYALDNVSSLFRNQAANVKGYALMLDEESLTGANAYFNTGLEDEKWNFVEGGLPELHLHSTKPEANKNSTVRHDTSWYGDGKATTFTLSDASDLYGFSRLSKVTNFAGKTILLDKNITVNTGDATTWGTNAPANEWIPISAFGDVNEFAGTFDGQMHTISGLYRKSATRGIALFVGTTGTSTVKNLRIENSYFHYDGYQLQSDGYVYPGYVASIAAWGNGNFENIYSSATIVSEGNCAGGIIAAVNKYATAEHLVKKCWFDGTVTLKDHANATTQEQQSYYAGGILGQVVNDNVHCTLIDCLNTGSVSGEINHLGGLCGYVADAGTLNIQNSLNVGTVTGDHINRICSIVGFVEGEIKANGDDQRSSLNLQNVYSLRGVALKDEFDHEYTGDGASWYNTYITGTVGVKTQSQLTGNNASTLLTGTAWKFVDGKTPILDFTWK